MLELGLYSNKALLKSAQVFNYLKHADDYGLKIENYDKISMQSSIEVEMLLAQ